MDTLWCSCPMQKCAWKTKVLRVEEGVDPTPSQAINLHQQVITHIALKHGDERPGKK